MMGILFLIRDRQTIVGPCRGTIRQCGKWVHGELIHSLGSIQSNQMPSTWNAVRESSSCDIRQNLCQDRGASWRMLSGVMISIRRGADGKSSGFELPKRLKKEKSTGKGLYFPPGGI